MLLRTREMLNAALTLDDPALVWVAAAAFGALIAVLVALAAHDRRSGIQLGAGTARVVRRGGRGCRLTEREVRVLQSLVGTGHHRQDAGLFRDRALLDGVLLRGRAALPAALRARHTGRLAVLLSIKARIEARSDAAIESSSSLSAGTRIVMTPALAGSCESEVIASLRDELACRVPGGGTGGETGGESRWRRGALVTVRAAPEAAGAEEGAPLFTTVLGYGWVGGRQALLLGRAAAPAAWRRRRPPRSCLVTRVLARLTAGDGEPRRHPVLLDEQRSRGALVALVAGRATIHSAAPLRAGSLVKVEVEAGRAARIPLYGKVVRSPRRSGGGMMQVQLTGISRRQLRGLYGFVDEFRAALPAARGPAPSW